MNRALIIKRKKKLALLALFISMEPEQKRIWVRDWIRIYGTNGHYENVYNEWRRSDPEMYMSILRVWPDQFDALLHMVGPYITKLDTQFRSAIKADKRLALTLRFLASGESYHSLSAQFCIGEKTIREIVPEVCDAIIRVLRHSLKTPSSPDEWKSIADEYWERWDYPHTIGALDGKHILIKCPVDGGSHYFNYKKQNSVVLMALVGPDYKFLYADVGMNGRVSDGGVWNRCQLKQLIDDNRIGLPESDTLPYHIIGDDAFPLSTRLLKPYPQKSLFFDRNKRIFNLRLSRARRCSENAFGILVNRFQIFRAPITASPLHATKFVMTCLSLHNWLLSGKKTNRLFYGDDCPAFRNTDGMVQMDEQFEEQFGNRSCLTGTEMRDSVQDFLAKEGARAFHDHLL